MEGFLTNPIVVVLIVAFAIQLIFQITRGVIAVRRSKKNLQDMEKLVQDSELRIKTYLNAIEENRRQLNRSVETMNELLEKRDGQSNG